MLKINRFLILVVFIAALSACSHEEKTYYPDGQVQSIIKYKGKKEHGKSVYFYNHPNTVEIEVEMRNGKREGEFRRYFINGLLDTHCYYINDSIDGIETMYLADGSKSQETTYVRGKKQGPHTAYHINGSIKLEGGFSNDMFDGDWIYYDERGVVVGEGNFKSGTGQVSFYYPTGQLERTVNYVNNQKDGKETFFTKAGEKYKIIEYKADRIVNESVDSALIK